MHKYNNFKNSFHFKSLINLSIVYILSRVTFQIVRRNYLNANYIHEMIILYMTNVLQKDTYLNKNSQNIECIANQYCLILISNHNCLPIDLHLHYTSFSFKTRSEISRNHWFGSCFWRKQSSNDHLYHCISFYGGNIPFDYVNLSTWLNYFNADGTETIDFKSHISTLLMLKSVIKNENE